MARVTFSGRQGFLRLYDGTADTPRYLEIPFVLMNFSGPLGKPRSPDPIVTTVGGYFHAPTSPEYESGFYEPTAINFTFWVNSADWTAHRAAFSNIDMASPWRVGAHTWQTSKGRGSIRLPDDSYKPTALFFDQNKKAVDVQVKWASTQASGSIVGMRYDETYFSPQSLQLTESPDFVEIRVSGALVYGNIEPIGDFTAGVSSI